MFMFGMGLTWLLSIGAILLTIGLAANAVWRAIMAPPGLPRGASCGSCGYEMTTLTEGRCPECGADLLLAGVMTRRTAIRVSGSLPAALMGWTVICIAIGSVGMGVASIIAMQSAFGGGMGNSPLTSTYTFAPDTEYDDETGAFAPSADYRIAIDSDVVLGGMGAQSGTIDATIDHEDAEVIIALVVETEDWTMTDDDGAELATGEEFTRADAEAAFAAAGLDTESSPALKKEAEHLSLLINGAMTDPWNYEYSAVMNMDNTPGGLTNTGGTMNSGMPGMATSPTQIALWLSLVGVLVLIWVLGMIFIVRRRGKIIRGGRPTPA